MQNQIRADMLKVKRMVSEVEMIIGKREGKTELVNKLIDAENLLTYCMSRLENAFVPPCKIGTTVYLPCLDDEGEIETYTITEFVLDKNGLCFVVDDEDRETHPIEEMGAECYLTPEQAEQKLKESEEK